MAKSKGLSIDHFYAQFHNHEHPHHDHAGDHKTPDGSEPYLPPGKPFKNSDCLCPKCGKGCSCSCRG
jgi:hypothetical protein